MLQRRRSACSRIVSFGKLKFKIKTLRFNRVIFRLGELVFLLNGTVEKHLNTNKERHLSQENYIPFNEKLYMDNLATGGTTFEEVESSKCISICKNQMI